MQELQNVVSNNTCICILVFSNMTMRCSKFLWPWLKRARAPDCLTPRPTATWAGYGRALHLRRLPPIIITFANSSFPPKSSRRARIHPILFNKRENPYPYDLLSNCIRRYRILFQCGENGKGNLNAEYVANLRTVIIWHPLQSYVREYSSFLYIFIVTKFKRSQILPHYRI